MKARPIQMEAESPDTAPASFLAGASLCPSSPAAVETAEFWEKWALASKLASATRGRLSPMPGNWRLGVRFFLVEPKSCFHAGAFGTRWSAIASICRRPAPVARQLSGRGSSLVRGDKCEAIACLRVAMPPAGSTPTCVQTIAQRRGRPACSRRGAPASDPPRQSPGSTRSRNRSPPRPR